MKCTDNNPIGLCFIDLAYKIVKNRHTKWYQFNFKQAIESWNKHFFNKMRPWSNKYNQNWLGYIHWLSHTIIWSYRFSTKFNLKLLPFVDSSVLKYKKDVTTTWQKQTLEKHRSNGVEKAWDLSLSVFRVSL